MSPKSPRFKARASKRRTHLTLEIGHKNKSTAQADTRSGQYAPGRSLRYHDPGEPRPVAERRPVRGRRSVNERRPVAGRRIFSGRRAAERRQAVYDWRSVDAWRSVESREQLVRRRSQSRQTGGLGSPAGRLLEVGSHIVAELKARMGVRARIVLTIAVSLVLVVLAPATLAALIHRARTVSAANVSSSLVAANSWNNTTDAAKTISVYNASNGQTMAVSLNQYILNVLAAQMPPTAPMASLQAAAVVIRTYAEKAMTRATQATQGGKGKGKGKHPADVTTSGVNDLQWLTDSQQENLFSSQYAVDETRLREAVSSTDGLIVTYHNAPIDAFLTRVSAGETRNGKVELGSHLPYLVPVKCPADVHSPNFESHFTFSESQLAKMLNVKTNQLVLKNLKVKSRDKQGYSTLISDGSYSWTGAAFAAKLELPSADMTFRVTGSKIEITTKGIGNGYGMSLYQARAWGKAGKSWKEILSKFYPGTKIQPSSL